MQIAKALETQQTDYSLDSFNYEYPEHLIADRPANPRDSSRLMVLDRNSGAVAHAYFRDLPRFLKPGDCIVINRTKVWPARILGKKTTGGKVEMLLLRELGPGWWTVLSSDLKPGLRVELADGIYADVEKKNEEGGWECRFSTTDVHGFMYRCGLPPLPPYILKKRNKRLAYAAVNAPTASCIESRSERYLNSTVSGHSRMKLSANSPPHISDFETYQTVFAKEEGSIAAPTAGLHFTPELLDAIRESGIKILEITLHVGHGTFQPITAADIRSHRMKSEWYRIDAAADDALSNCRRRGGRIVAVGTTATRTLESSALTGRLDGWTDLFIHPGYEFKAIDALVTNFHLPHSTPLVLASAFAGKERLLSAYRQAIQKRYRLYSFGDAMLII